MRAQVLGLKARGLRDKLQVLGFWVQGSELLLGLTAATNGASAMVKKDDLGETMQAGVSVARC